MLRIISGCLPRTGTSMAQAACFSGHVGCVSLEYSKPEEVKAWLDEMVLAGVDFSVSISRLTPELTNLLKDCVGCGLTQVILTEALLSELQVSIPALKDLGLKPIVQITSLDQAVMAEELGAEAIIVKGNESGGLVGEETTLILLQRIAPKISIPVYARGGIGAHTAGACLVAGAAGVVLDWQLALCEESDVSAEIKTRVARMDGSETAILGQNCDWRYRVYARPGEAAYFELKDLEEKSLHPDVDGAELDLWKDEVEKRIEEKGLLLIGQDASFAARLAAQYRTVKGICDAIRNEAMRHVRTARQHNPVREDGPIAQSHGSRFPILQGPMTRVSDRADFAFAVADGGGLPFLALALMRGPQVKTLLEDTKKKLGDRPWGIGILGFVPKELREEQLAEALKIRPPYAIIAGGRPDQAKALEQEGIRTYLHVPSPELLRMFLESGARRVIFEGRECGGHVGPRTSFVLWELMVETILTHLAQGADRASDYHVIFAGGIHDGISAAMVSTLAAPLSEKGVRVGVLLGTGYLFTKECVEGGAIVDGFQREAISCEETILLESGVGHATRCAKTPFGDLFANEKRRLSREGRSKEEMREALEMLNLGRLRIASKGITRDTAGDSGNMVELDDAKQRVEGMYMIGQVAALRDKVCTVEELHQDVCNAERYLESACEKMTQFQLDFISSQPQPLRPSKDIAIIGVSCVFPKAESLDAFWQNILTKVNAIEEVPKERWDVDTYFDKDRRAQDKIYSRWGGFLGPVNFDPARYGMPPNSVPSVDPMQLLMLEMTSRALDDAGYAKRPFDRENTSVIVGAGGGVGDLGMGYGFRSLLPHYMTESGGTANDAAKLIEDLEHCLPTWTEDSFAGLLLNVIAGRVANRLDLGGTNYTVDAACATSLAAVRLAVNELEAGSSNMVIVAGVDTMQSPFGYLCFSKTQALSPTGELRTFDESANGIVISEGVAVAVLKRLEDAVRDGDRVYAVIKSVGASSDGKDKGLTAPRPIGQVRALERAYTKAEVAPSSVGLIEAHGTGTVVGDRTEVESLTRFFEGSESDLQSCALGSVKSMIGHTKCTAGMAGLIKAAMALHNKVLPPTIGITKPNSKANFSSSPFYLNTETRPWLSRTDETPRRAGVSAFGFGGTNFHAVLEETPELNGESALTQTIREWPAELFIWKAESAAAVHKALDHLASAVAAGARPVLSEVAAAVCWEYGKAVGRHCLAIVATSLEDLVAKIDTASAVLKKGDATFRDPRGIYYSASPIAERGNVAFLFPGQGSQRPDMLIDLAVAFSLVRETFEDADRSLGDRLGQPLSRYIFPLPAFTPEEKNAAENAIKQTNVAQPAVGTADMAMYRLLSSLGIRPSMTAGHSYGEFVALAAAGAIPFDELIRISEARGRFIVESAKDELGTMAAIDADEAVVAPVVKRVEGVVIANLNSSQQTVISGTERGVTDALAKFKEIGVNGRRFPVACAFHSTLVAGAQVPLREALDASAVSVPVVPVFSNTTTLPHSDDAQAIRSQLVEHLTKPVRFADELRAMYDAGARIFIEVGPGRVLTGLAERTLGDRDVMMVATDQAGRNGLLHLVHTLGLLATAGLPFHAYHLFEGRVERKLELARLVEQTKPVAPSPTTWTIAHGRAVPVNGVKRTESVKKEVKAPPVETVPLPVPPLAPAPVALEKPVAPKPPAVPLPRPTTAAKSSIDLAMQNHQQLMAKFLDTHKNVMMAYLQGAGAGASATLSVSDPLPASLAVPLRKGDTEAPQPLAAADLSVPLTKGDSRGAERPAGGRSAAIVTRETVLQRLVALVSERTGYPEEMLGVDLDLEADLGVDSIKRVEILGALQNESALSTGSIEGEIENLSKLKTLRAIAEWITDRAAGESLTEHPALPAAKTPEPVTVAATIITTDVVIKRLVALVAERTGYPEEMLAVDLDLEADLGVDSIKRVEILGALQNESSLGMSALEGEIENLSKLKTLRAIAEWIAEKASEKLGTAPNSELQELGPVPNFSVDTAVSRLTIELVGAGTHEAAAPLTGIALISNDGVIAPLLAKELSRAGVAAHVLDRNCDLADMNTVTAIVESIRNRGPVTAFIHLSPLAESRSMDPKLWQARLDQDLKSLFNFLRCLETDLRKDGAGRLLVATRLGGSFASGLREHTNGFWPGNGAVCGLVKSVAREWADISSRVVDFEFDISNEAIVRSLVSELTIAKGAVEVGYRDGNRMTLMSVPSPINGNPARIQINRDDVVLITGGARGITAAVAVELARNFQCKLILAGRSPLPPSTEPSNIAGILDPKQLKAALLKHAKESGQQCSPASIEVMFRKISQEREIRSSLAAMAQAGSHVEYHSVDVTDTAAFGSFIDKLYALHGRLDGVIHGAGIIEDKLIRDKSPESFDRVVKPKVTGALVLVEKLRPEALKFLAFFSSVSARYGNRGQGDYAAANEVLNKLAMWLNHRWPGRVLSLNWGPWKTENGMVSSALAAQFAKAGVQLIEPEIGPKIFVRELLFGQKEDAEIIWGGPIFHERPASPAAAPRPTRFDMHYPLLSGPAEIAMAEDGSVVVLRETDPKNDIYLADHQLDGKPVMPMAMTLEFFAEAAAAMNPGKKVVKVGNLKVLRGVTFPEQKPKVFRIQGTPHHDAVDLKLMVGDGRDLHYTATAEILTAHRNVEAPALELVKPARLRMSVPELYENWLFHGPAFAGIEEIAGVGENGIVARLKLSNPGDLFNYRPKDKWLVDPVVIDSGLQLIIVWARHYFDTTPLPSRLGACHVFELPASGNVRCEVKIDHQPGSPTLMTDLKFFDGNNRLFAWLEEMEATCSKALNRLSGSYLAARGTQK